MPAPVFLTKVELPVTVSATVFVQPVVPSVKVNVAVPALTPTTSPELSTVAIPSSLLDQVPPEDGVTLVDPPTHTLVAPDTVGLPLMVKLTVFANTSTFALELFTLMR